MEVRLRRVLNARQQRCMSNPPITANMAVAMALPPYAELVVIVVLPHGAFDRALIARPTRSDVHMVVLLSVMYPLVTGAMIVAQDDAEHLSSALRDFRRPGD